MDRATMIKDFKKYINDNRDKIMSCSVDIKDLPPDDEWINDDEWDKVYADEVTDGENVSITDSKLKWMSISEMEKDENIMQKNEEIIAFVKANCE